MSGSSTDDQNQTTVEPVVEIDETTVESSTTESEDAKPESMLEAVQSAVAEDETTPSSDVGEEPGEPGAEENSGDDTGIDASTDDDTDDPPPFHEHPRWQAMLTENRTLKENGERLDEMDEYLKSSGLEDTDIQQGVELIRLLKNDPMAAAEALAPVMEQLQQFQGSGALPDDLQADVDSGKLTEEYARELAQTRSKSTFFERQTVEQRGRQQADDDQRIQDQQLEAQSAIKTSVTDWENNWKTSDPDFEKKHPYVRDRVASLARDLGRPVTGPAEALELSKKAKSQIDKEMASMFPVKQEKRTVKGGSSTVTKLEPKTLLEAVTAAAVGEG